MFLDRCVLHHFFNVQRMIGIGRGHFLRIFVIFDIFVTFVVFVVFGRQHLVVNVLVVVHVHVLGVLLVHEGMITFVVIVM